MTPRPPSLTLFPYTTLFRSHPVRHRAPVPAPPPGPRAGHVLASLARAGAGEELRRAAVPRSEEHTSELQSRPHLVCRLLLEKKKNGFSQLSINFRST